MRTQFVTHERSTLQYLAPTSSGRRPILGLPLCWVPQSDSNAVELSAAMWW